MPRGTQLATNDRLQLEAQVDQAQEECEYLRKYIVLTRMLRRAEDDLTTCGYDASLVDALYAQRDTLIKEMVEEIQLNEVLDDYEGKIERALS